MVFTDLVGSVTLKRRLGNVRALALLDEHDTLVRAVLREFPDGTEISTAGDSFFLAFHRPSDAVGFALRLQACLREWNRGKPVPARDRIGIHAGEVAVELNAEGGLHDLKGIEVDKCSRVMSLARANQILLTGFAFENALGFLEGLPLPGIGELSWISHGACRLKGMREAVEIFEVGETGHAPLAAPRGVDRKRVWGGAALTAFLGFAALVTGYHGPAEPISNASYDLAYMFRKAEKPTNAVLILMDSDSHEKLGQPKNRPWDRIVHAQLLDRLREYEAKAVVLDVHFDGTNGTSPAANSALVAAAKRHGRVAVAAILSSAETSVTEQNQWKPPFPDLAAAVPYGVVHRGPQTDAVPRRPGKGSQEHDKDSLAREVVRMLGGKLPPPNRDVWLNYYGPPHTTIEKVSYWLVLSNKVSATNFAQKIVFVGGDNDERVGPTGGWEKDEAPTPYSLWLRRNAPGVEIAATTTLNLLNGDWLRRLGPWTEVIMVILAGAVTGAGLSQLRAFKALLVGLTAAVGVGLISMLLVWPTQVWFPWLIISGVQIPVALLWSWVAWRAPAPRQGVILRTATRQAPAASDPAPATKPPLAPPPPPADSPTRPTDGPGRPAVPNYELYREIGQGAYGQVWLARDTVRLWRAVKIVRRDSFRDPRPYEREFAGIQRFTPISLEHPGLLRILHVGRAPKDEYFFYVMELADAVPSRAGPRRAGTDPAGEPLPGGAGDPPPPGRGTAGTTCATREGRTIAAETRRQVKSPFDGAPTPGFDPDHYTPRTLRWELKNLGPLPARDVIRVGAALADALQFLHAHHLIHRDVKPENVLFVRGHPKLADIGLVTTMADVDAAVSNIGTFGYIAPEGPGTAAADIFSLAMLLYVVATGCDPREFPELPGELERRADLGLLMKLSEIWCRAGEANPARRHPTAAVLAAALRELDASAENREPPKAAEKGQSP